MIHDYLSRDVPSVLACTKHVFSQLLTSFFRGIFKAPQRFIIMLFCIKSTPGCDEKEWKDACAESARLIYSNEPRKINNKLHSQCGESVGATGSTWTRVFFICPYLLLPVFAHRCHLASPCCTVSIYPWPPFHRLKHIIGDYSAIGSEMCCITAPLLCWETCHHNLASVGSLLFADLSCCWLELTNSQCNAFSELFGFALMNADMEFLFPIKLVLAPALLHTATLNPSSTWPSICPFRRTSACSWGKFGTFGN